MFHVKHFENVFESLRKEEQIFMNQEQINEILVENYNYLIKEKEKLFNQIEAVKQNIETAQIQMQEKKSYIKLQREKQLQENNIFSLYDTSGKYELDINQNEEEMRQIIEEKDQCEQNLELLESDFEQITNQIISNQILRKSIVELFENQMDSGKDVQKEPDDRCGKENLIKSADIKGEVSGIRNYTDIVKRLEFCRDILELDKARCSLELTMLIDELS